MSLVPLLAIIAPFLIWPIEQIFPYPYIIEEIIKAGMIWYLVRLQVPTKQLMQTAIISAVLFTFSESVFYIINFIGVSLNPLVERLFITGVLHLTTTVIILASALYHRRLIILGLLIAMILHFLYNSTLNLS